MARNLRQGLRFTLLSLTLGVLLGSAGLAHADKGRHERETHHKHHSHHEHHKHRKQHVIHRGPVYVVPPQRIRHHREVVIVRPHGHWYHGYGHYHADNDAYMWLAFTAITLKVLDNLNEQQQREHEAAQVRATSAEVGETIYWNQGNASGSVTATRDGTSTSGRYCREFQQVVTIGGRTEEAYGTACQQPDGSWEVVSTGSP